MMEMVVRKKLSEEATFTLSSERRECVSQVKSRGRIQAARTPDIDDSGFLKLK